MRDKLNRTEREHNIGGEVTPLEEEVTALNNPDNRKVQDETRELDMFEDEGLILKKLFKY